MPHHKRPYFRQKPVLYFDENFPARVVEELKRDNRFRKLFRILSVFDLENENRDDEFQYSFCKRKDFVLVSPDQDFMSDRKYPIQKMPGTVVISCDGNQIARIRACLMVITNCLSYVPLPKVFMGDSKFQVSPEGCVMRGRDSRTREIKSITIRPGDSMRRVADHFHYFG